MDGDGHVIEDAEPGAFGAKRMMSSAGKRPTTKEMGLVIKDVQAKIAATGLRAEGRQVSEIVKAELAKG